MTLDDFMAEPNQKESEIEKSLKEYQIVQEQLRAAALQVEQLQIQKAELEGAKAEVEKSTGKVYVTIGGVIVETSKEGASKEIAEKSELVSLRLQSANKQYADYREKEKQLREKLSQLSGAGAG